MVPISSNQTFRKHEKLCSKKVIDALFTTGRSFYQNPIKAIIGKGPLKHTGSIKVLISVPKRNLRRAVDRNRMKRLLRESYRRNKKLLTPMLEPQQEYEFSLALIYTSKQLSDYSLVEKSMITLFHQIASSIDFFFKQESNELNAEF